ncbi:MAG: ATP-dependent DNA helicase RecG [Bacteroidia bacterium]|nr:MAG: ATP-dependent DNA helicase RecG [Bacteroidia bacterium]
MKRLQYLDTPVEYLKGVGPKRADLLREELEIFTFQDLLHFYPFRYIDRSRFFTVSEVRADMLYVQIRGRITDIQLHGKNRTTRMTAWLEDATGRIELVWFRGFKWLKDQFKPGVEYIVFGKPSLFGSKFTIAHPEVEPVTPGAINQDSAMQPVYNSTEKLKSMGLDSRGIGKLVKTLLPQVRDHIRETLPSHILASLKMLPRDECLLNVHFPVNDILLKKARARLKFEELFYIQVNLLQNRMLRNSKLQGHVFTQIGDYFNDFFHKHLSFSLTAAQKRVLKEIRGDTLSGRQMNRLLQGDVGSGKTIVALMSMLMAIDNGFQSSLMAPTEILAFQHYESISTMLRPLGLRIGLLTGSTKSADRREILADLKEGRLDILIGTHALIEDVVRFKRLGLVVIDEQHRFGVAQRARLWSKSQVPPHVLVMTATPIPRTLAMTLYGDLDVSVIDELPPGRKPIKTLHQYDRNRLKVFGFMREQIKSGRQVYVVYPLIQESEKLDLKDLTDGYESIVRDFPPPRYSVSIVHGRMKPADKDYEMQRFAQGHTHIMVATTVIEVGIDVPNATVMVIESAERFGLSQLHQLRGRVGRGAEQSYCILMSKDELSIDARKRLEVMVTTNDGFRIAETDLQLRGPGDIQGTQQSGILDLKIADLTQDEGILQFARKQAKRLLEDDPMLDKSANRIVRAQLNKLYPESVQWGRIS